MNDSDQVIELLKQQINLLKGEKQRAEENAKQNLERLQKKQNKLDKITKEFHEELEKLTRITLNERKLAVQQVTEAEEKRKDLEVQLAKTNKVKKLINISLLIFE